MVSAFTTQEKTVLGAKIDDDKGSVIAVDEMKLYNEGENELYLKNSLPMYSDTFQVEFKNMDASKVDFESRKEFIDKVIESISSKYKKWGYENIDEIDLRKIQLPENKLNIKLSLALQNKKHCNKDIGRMTIMILEQPPNTSNKKDFGSLTISQKIIQQLGGECINEDTKYILKSYHNRIVKFLKNLILTSETK